MNFSNSFDFKMHDDGEIYLTPDFGKSEYSYEMDKATFKANNITLGILQIGEFHYIYYAPIAYVCVRTESRIVTQKSRCEVTMITWHKKPFETSHISMLIALRFCVTTHTDSTLFVTSVDYILSHKIILNTVKLFCIVREAFNKVL